MKQKIRIGCGAGFSGDRLDPARILVEQGDIDYLVLECLAERTIALAQKRKQKDPSSGFDPLLERRVNLLLEPLLQKGVTLITNMGAANPVAAAERIASLARTRGLLVKVVAVLGDDVLSELSGDENSIETGTALKASGPLVSANAYMGVDGILEALQYRPNIIITGRVADPSLFLAPMIYEFSWQRDNYKLLGQGTIVGHLLECAGQITGGYFADPILKPVSGMANLGHPYADVFHDGTALISKVAGTGGVVSLAAAKEQLLYEVVNPNAYYTPDVIADFTTVHLEQIELDTIRVIGGTGRRKPETLKVSVGYQAMYMGEGEITYAGVNAVQRARLAGEIVSERLKDLFPALRVDLIGHSSVHGDDFAVDHQPYEVRLRVAGKSQRADQAALIGEEVEALYTNGPAGGGGVRKYVHEVVGIVSSTIDRRVVKHQTKVFTS
ncbi:MAG: DUF1446 domain-containing protein [Chryseolinea sp.]